MGHFSLIYGYVYRIIYTIGIIVCIYGSNVDRKFVSMNEEKEEYRNVSSEEFRRRRRQRRHRRDR